MTRADIRRRILGVVFLTISLLMLLCGLTLLKASLSPKAFVIYWLSCMVFTFLTLIVALLDLRAVRLRSLQEREQLAKAVFRDFTETDGNGNRP